MVEQTQPIQTTISPPASGLPEEIVAELDKMAKKHGLRYNKLETDYKTIVARPDMTLRSAADQKWYAFLMLSAECSRYADNPLIDYEMMVYGVNCNENWGNSKIIAGTIIPGKDVPDLFNGSGKMGIPTLITNFKDNFRVVEKIQPFGFYRANLTTSQVGAVRREITSTIDSEFTPINHPEITQEQIKTWLDKTYPFFTLAQCKTNLSKLIQPTKAGSKPFPDLLDLRRVVVSLKNTNLGSRKDNTQSEFAQYTVIDDSLTDEEKLNVKDATGKTILYGGIPMSVPVFMYKQLNMDANAVIEALVTVRKVKPKEDGTTTSKTGIALDAVAIFPIINLKKKSPQVQTPTRQTQEVQAVDLAVM